MRVLSALAAFITAALRARAKEDEIPFKAGADDGVYTMKNEFARPEFIRAVYGHYFSRARGLVISIL